MLSRVVAWKRPLLGAAATSEALRASRHVPRGARLCFGSGAAASEAQRREYGSTHRLRVVGCGQLFPAAQRRSASDMFVHIDSVRQEQQQRLPDRDSNEEDDEDLWETIGDADDDGSGGQRGPAATAAAVEAAEDKVLAQLVDDAAAVASASAATAATAQDGDELRRPSSMDERDQQDGRRRSGDRSSPSATGRRRVCLQPVRGGSARRAIAPSQPSAAAGSNASLADDVSRRDEERVQRVLALLTALLDPAARNGAGAMAPSSPSTDADGVIPGVPSAAEAARSAASLALRSGVLASSEVPFPLLKHHLPPGFVDDIRRDHGGVGLLRWLRERPAHFDVSGDGLAVAPSGTMSSARLAPPSTFEARAPSLAKKEMASLENDQWFVELDLDAPLGDAAVIENHGDDESEVEASLDAVRDARATTASFSAARSMIPAAPSIAQVVSPASIAAAATAGIHLGHRLTTPPGMSGTRVMRPPPPVPAPGAGSFPVSAVLPPPPVPTVPDAAPDVVEPGAVVAAP